MCLINERLADNIDAWRRIEAPSVVQKWLTDGVSIPFRDNITPPSFYWENYSVFCKKENNFLENEIKVLCATGAIRPVISRPYCVSPIKCVPKKTGDKYRIVADLSRLNNFVEAPHFQQESINTVAEQVQAGDELVTFDLKSGFFHVPVHVDSQKFLGFEFQGQFYVWCVLPFGLSCSPYFFNKVIRPVVCFVRSQGIKLCVFVDDGLVSAKPGCIVDHRDFVLDTFIELGFLINYEKSYLEPSSRREYIGFIIDSRGPDNRPWLYIPKNKVGKLKRDIRRCLRLGYIHVRLLAKVAGQIIAMSKAVLPGKLRIRSLYNLLSTKCSWSDVLMLNVYVIEDLSWWIQAIDGWNGSPLRARPVEGQIWTDASDTGWGCVYGESEASGTWSSITAPRHINYKELQAVHFALRSFMSEIAGKSIQILSDNVTTVAYVNNMGGPVCELTALAEAIWATALENSIELVAKHVPGVSNTAADRLSRLPIQYEWMIHPVIFRQLDSMWGPHTIDRFASMSTTQLPRYNSRFLDPATRGVDALAQTDWACENNYVNPPFRLINRVLDVVISQRAYATVIAPRWPGQVWFSRLRQLQISSPIRIPNIPGLMLRMGDLAEPLKNRHWKIYAWRIYGGVGCPERDGQSVP